MLSARSSVGHGNVTAKEWRQFADRLYAVLGDLETLVGDAPAGSYPTKPEMLLHMAWAACLAERKAVLAREELPHVPS